MHKNDLEQPDLSAENPPFSMDVWFRLVKSEEALYRCDALENLPDEASDDEVAEVVLNSLQDNNALVRACAADAARLLRGWEEIADALRHLIKKETDNVTLAYAYASLGRVGSPQDISIFAQGLDITTDARVRLGIMSGLCLLVREIFLFDIYSLMKAKDSGLFYVAVQVFLHMSDDEAIIEKELLDGVETHLKTISLEELSRASGAFQKLLTRVNERNLPIKSME